MVLKNFELGFAKKNIMNARKSGFIFETYEKLFTKMSLNNAERKKKHLLFGLCGWSTSELGT